jgi:hypothetical protein
MGHLMERVIKRSVLRRKSEGRGLWPVNATGCGAKIGIGLPHGFSFIPVTEKNTASGHPIS